MTAQYQPIRVPFTAIDEAVHHLDTPSEPWSIELEVKVEGSLDEERLRQALAATFARHPMTRARKLPARRTAKYYEWEITAGPDLDPLRVVDCLTPESLERQRSELHSISVPLVESPPFRMRLARCPAGDVLMVNVNHAAFDGFGALRLLQSVAREYSGRPDPPPAVSLSEARDLRAHLCTGDAEVRRRRIRAVAGKLRDLVDPPARLAPEGASGEAGYGLIHQSLSPDQTEALNHIDSRWTVNDVLLATLNATVAAWNAGHGRTCRRIGVLVPVNLRPKDWRNDVVTNFVLDARVVSNSGDRADRVAALNAVTQQMKEIKEGAGAALMEVLAPATSLPLWMKQPISTLLWLTGNRLVDTALLSNLGRIQDPPEFGDGAGAGKTVGMWFSAPGRMPCGLTLGVLTLPSGQMHISFRYRRALFGPAAASQFAGAYITELELMAKAAS